MPKRMSWCVLLVVVGLVLSACTNVGPDCWKLDPVLIQTPNGPIEVSGTQCVTFRDPLAP